MKAAYLWHGHLAHVAGTPAIPLQICVNRRNLRISIFREFMAERWQAEKWGTEDLAQRRSDATMTMPPLLYSLRRCVVA